MTVIDAIRRPEYVGRNRCWPCTALNALILGAVAIVVGVVSPLAGLAVVAVGATAIWLRGYLVPYTPQFAPRIADALPVDFGHGGPERTPGSLAAADDPEPDAVLGALLEQGILVAEEDTLFISATFREAWDREREALRDATSEELAAAAAEAAPGEPEATPMDDGLLTLRSERSEDETWLSRPIAIAEAAAVRALTETAPGMDAAARATAAGALRAFLDTCPACGTDLVETSPEVCCVGKIVDADTILYCPVCQRRLYTIPE